MKIKFIFYLLSSQSRKKVFETSFTFKINLMWKYYPSNNPSKRPSNSEEQKIHSSTIPKQIKKNDFVQVEFKFSQQFGIQINLPKFLQVKRLHQIASSYIKLHQKFRPDDYFECTGLYKKTNILNLINQHQEGSWQKYTQEADDSLLLTMDNVRLENFCKQFIIVDLLYEKIQLKQEKSPQNINVERKQSWLKNIQIFQNLHFLKNKLYKHQQDIQELNNHFSILIRPFKQIKLFRMLYYSRNFIRKNRFEDQIFKIKNLLALFDFNFSEKLIQSLRTNQGYFFIFKFNHSLQVKNYLQFCQDLGNSQIHLIFKQIISIIKHIFNSKSNILITLIRYLISCKFSLYRILDIFCFSLDDGHRRLTLNTEYIVELILNSKLRLNENISLEKISLQIMEIFKTIVNKKCAEAQIQQIFQNDRLIVMNQYCQMIESKQLIKKHLQWQLIGKYIKFQDSIELIKDHFRIIKDEISKILERQILKKQKNQFQFVREQTRIYLANEDIDIHEKSTVKKYEKKIIPKIDKPRKNTKTKTPHNQNYNSLNHPVTNDKKSNSHNLNNFHNIHEFSVEISPNQHQKDKNKIKMKRKMEQKNEMQKYFQRQLQN